MCGHSDAEIQKQKIEIYFGYYGGGSLEVGSMEYCQKNSAQMRHTMKNRLMSFDKEDLAEMLLQFVDNGYEG